MSPRVQRICVFCGPAGLGLLLVGLLVAGWFPPPSPHQSALSVAHMYQTRTDRIRLASIIIPFAGMMTVPFVAVVSTQMMRIEGHRGPLWMAQLGAGAIGVVPFIVPPFFWQAAAYDPHRDPQITLVLHVAGWLPTTAAVFPAMAQNISIAAAIFTDRRAEPVLPRWLGYLSAWVALLFFPSVLALFFHHGAFSWNGIATFWLGAVAFGAWFNGMVFCLLKAIDSQVAEEQGAGPVTPSPVTA